MKAIVFLLIYLCSISIFSQELRFRDDTVFIKIQAKGHSQFEKFDYTSLDAFQQYRPFGKNRLPMARLGNLGLPVHSYNILSQDWDVNANIGGYQPYLMHKDSMKFYQASRPFTLMNYANGGGSEQLFDVLHTQNLGEGLNISFNYRRTVSEGFFQNQLTSHTQFNATMNLKTRDQRFHSKAYYLINNIKAQENGGVSVLDNPEDNSILLQVNLNNAQNKMRTSGFGVVNAYELLLDSNAVFLNISHEFSYHRNFKVFKDQFDFTRPFHKDFFLDSLRSADSSFADVLSNELMLNIFNNNLSVGVKNEQYHYFQNHLIDRDFSSNYLVFRFASDIYGRKTEAYFEKGISGFHKDEIDLSSKIELVKNNKTKLLLTAFLRNKQADFFVQNQRTNQHFFNQQFETSNNIGAKLHFFATNLNFSASLGFESFENYIYYNSQLEPTQLSNSFSAVNFNVSHKVVFLKHLHFKNLLQFQTIEEEAIVPLPTFYSYHSLYYENVLYNEALTFQIGLDYYYIGENTAYAYSPTLTQFFVSESTEKLGGNGQLDLFLNFQIDKSFRFFAKMENVLNEEFSKESIRVQNYAIPGRVFKVGLSWRMIN